jgi:hypothetical protein
MPRTSRTPVLRHQVERRRVATELLMFISVALWLLFPCKGHR